LQPVTLDAELRRPLNYPASICTLSQGQDATTIVYMALLSLLGQGAIKLQYTMTSRTFFNIPLPEYQESMRAEYGVIRQVHETFKASQPDISSELARAIERAIRSLLTWDSY